MPDYAFSRIQKVEIGIHPVHCCLFIRDFLKIISYVQTLGAILKTFSLDLRLIGHAIREEQMDQIMEVGRSMVCGFLFKFFYCCFAQFKIPAYALSVLWPKR